MAREPDPYAPAHPVPGKPVVKSFPTPNLADRIYVVRKDSRAGDYRVPTKGEPYKGPEAQRLKGFMFATAVPSDQTGWVDWYYLNERANQDDYNATIEYPYTDANYPRITRSYVLLRGDVTEPTADDVDPVYNGNVGDSELPFAPFVLKLIEHKETRIDDPVLDALFVGVQRSYERLPSPIITSYDQNEVKQVVTVQTQEVETAAIPTSSALTEVLKVERTTTAKAKVTTGTVDNLFPADLHAAERADLMPAEFRGLIPNITEAWNEIGLAADPTLLTGELKRSEQQINKFVRRMEVTSRRVTLPVSFFNKDMGGLSQGRFGEGFTGVLTITNTLAPGMQTIAPDIFTTDAEVRALGDGTSVKKVTKVDGGWPILRDRLVDPETGIAVNVTKQVIPILTAAFAPKVAGYVDVHSYDRWRSIQIASKVDLSTLPPPETIAVTTDLALPATLESVKAEWSPTQHFLAAHSNVKFDKGDKSGGATGRWLTLTNTTSTIVEITIDGVIIVKLRHGYRGIAKARLVRTYLPGPPGVGTVPEPLLIRPTSGFAFLRGSGYSDIKSVGFGDHSRHYTEKNVFHETAIGPCLVGTYEIGNAIFIAQPVQVDATSLGMTEIGADAQGDGVSMDSTTQPIEYQLSNSAGGAGTLVVDIDASDPSAIVAGQEILSEVRVTRQRFGIYVQELIYATIPSTP